MSSTKSNRPAAEAAILLCVAALAAGCSRAPPASELSGHASCSASAGCVTSAVRQSHVAAPAPIPGSPELQPQRVQPTEPPDEDAITCIPGPSLLQSDQAIECHTAVPQKVFYWHFSNPGAMAAALRDLTAHICDATAVSGDCSASWNGEATQMAGGVETDLLACPTLPSVDVAVLLSDGQPGSCLVWENESQQMIAMTADPHLVAADPYRWWQAEYPRTSR